MTEIDRDWFVQAYDSYVADSSNDGAALEKSRDAVATAYADAVESGTLPRWEADLVSEGRALFNRFIDPERTKRKTSVRKSWDHLLDALSDDTILGRNDPALALAYPIGDGRDKTLFYWSPEDFQTSAMERHRNAEAAHEAAVDYNHDYAQTFVAAMKRRGVTYFGALFRDA